ncbi:MAG: Ig-like domain-containing protein, partial [Gemmatimonadetes bacterium]|nr:Ig-like domain-containing protein [Gemmatimonadota bacterium]
MIRRRAQRSRRTGSRLRSVPNPTLLGLVAVLGAVLLIQACTNRDIVSVIVTAVSVTPPAGSMVEGDTLRFRAIVTDDRGGSLNGVPVEWSVTDSSVISVDANGLVTALSRGTARVRAEFRGEVGEATVEVFLAPRIALDPAALAFFGGVDGAPIPPQVVAVTNAGGDRLEGLAVEIRYGAGQPTDWLEAVFASQTANTTLTVTAISASLIAGQYSAELVITSTTDRVANNGVILPVTLSLSDFAVVESDGTTEVTEAGSTDDFTVALAKQPDSDVVLFVTSADVGEVTAFPAGLTFTPDDWDVPQAVTVTGVDDLVDDGDVQTSIVISVDDANSDDAFDPTPDFNVVVTTLDDDTAGMVVTQTNGSTLVTEAGVTDTLSVVLESEPASLVVINVITQDAGEASVSPDQLTFDATNWTVPQVVTVTGVDDFVIDGDVQTDVVVEVDTLATTGPYTAVPSQTVNVTTVDDDTGALVLSRDSAAVDETGTTDSITVTLSVMPDSAVTLAVASADIGEVTALPDTITIQPAEWNVGKVVTFTGVDDLVSDGPQVATVTVSVVAAASDGDFDAAPAATVDVTNADNDSPGFLITETDGGTTVSESGTTDDFQVVLNTQPQAGTVVALDVVSPAVAEVTVSPGTIQFDESTWNTPVTVTVTGVDDGEDDGDEVTEVAVSIGGATTDPDYSSVPAQAVSVTTIDTKLVITEIGGGTTVVSEFGTTDFFDVSLSHPPSSDVVVSVVSDDTGEATVDRSQLTFTPDNWSTAQAITVTGVDDLIDDGDVVTDVRLTVLNVSSDPIFHDVADTVEVTTTDNDGAGINVVEIGGTVVSEGGGGTTDQFDVSLTARPAPGTSVVLDVSSGDTGEVTVDKAQLSFTPGNWNSPQTVTATGVPDNTVDGDQNTDITLSVNLAGTSDPAYTSVSDRLVGATTLDVDVATLTVANAFATEGGNVVFSVSLSDGVEGGLSVDVTLTDGTAVAPADYDGTGGTLNFAGTPGEIEQFSVSTVNDAIVEGNETFSLSLSASNPAVDDTDTATGTINNNDASAVTVNNATVTEGGDLAFNVTLSNPVQGGLTVDVALSGGTATGGPAPLAPPEDYNNVVGQLTFAGTAGEVELFTVATLDDVIVEGAENFTVSLSPSHASVTAGNTGTGTINDNDNAAVTVDNASATEGGGLTFTVSLDNAVAGGFTVNVTLTDGSATGGAAPLAVPEDYDNVVVPLTFAGTAGETEQFTVATLDDAVFEGTETFTVGLSASNGAVGDSDGGSGTILDNDGQPTVTLIASPTSLAENGSANPSVVTATLSNPSTQAVTVTLGFSGTASLTDDYTRTGDQIVIPAGSLSRNREVSAVQDNLDEPDETVIVDITNVTNATEQGTQQQTITIVDDDEVTVSWTAASQSGSEAVGSMTVTAQLSGSSAS